MRCCVECFASDYLRPIVKSFSVEKGTCDFCRTVEIALCDPRELFDYFRSILDLYSPVSKMIGLGYDSSDYENSIGVIHKRLLLDFGILLFNLKDPDVVELLVVEIFKDNEPDYRFLFAEAVILEHLYNYSEYGDSSELVLTWGNFVKEIKTQNRFHLSSKVDLDSIGKLLRNYSKHYKKGKIFYRGRISDIAGFPKDRMGQPPAAYATAGRANPAGISYLYVAEGIDTTLYETRASLYDYVSIGEFTTKEEIRVVNLRESYAYDPILLAENEVLRHFMLNLPFLKVLEEELSRPMRRSDNDLDYLPTQYLSEFIKSLGFDGIEYRSSLNPAGYNLAIFNSDKLECTKSYVHEIKKITFLHDKLQ